MRLAGFKVADAEKMPAYDAAVTKLYTEMCLALAASCGLDALGKLGVRLNQISDEALKSSNRSLWHACRRAKELVDCILSNRSLISRNLFLDTCALKSIAQRGKEDFGASLLGSLGRSGADLMSLKPGRSRFNRAAPENVASYFNAPFDNDS